MTIAVEKLKEEIERTGVSIYAILRGKMHDKPKGLNSNRVRAWLHGMNTNPNLEQLSYVLSLYDSLPDNPWIELDSELRGQLMAKKEELKGLFPKYYRKNPPPCDTSLAVMSQLFLGKAKRIRKLHLDYLLGIAI